MKTTKADFRLFKETFLMWQQRLGLTQYDVVFQHVEIDGRYAEITIQQLGKLATVRLNSDTGNEYLETDVRTHAKHEAMHLLLSRLAWLGQTRYLENHDLEEEEEAIVRRLEKVLV